MENRQSRERGQVMILMAIGLVVFLGFVALAIDGGMIYTERRNAQNASDAASLAGGGAAAISMENSFLDYAHFTCADGRVAVAEAAAIGAAIDRAGSNSYTIDNSIADKNGVVTECGIDTSHGVEDKYIDVTVDISTTIRTNFAQVLFANKMTSQQGAITRVRPRSPLAFGNAIVGLNTNDCTGSSSGVSFGGSSDVHVDGGGVYSNGCLRGDGSGYNVSVGGGGSVSYAGNTAGTMNFDPAPQDTNYQLPTFAYQAPPPDCSAAGAHTMNHDLTVHNNETVDMDAGLWCIDGDIKVTGGTLNAVGVTFYLATGSVTINGGDNMDLAAPATSPDPSPAIGGMLFYVAQGDVSITGNNTSAYEGLIYAPHGDVYLSGASETHPTFNTQIVAYNVQVSGNAWIDINFDAAQQYSRPTMIELWK